MIKEKKNQSQAARPPIVVVMGHIDHGKTTLLDWFRKSTVAAGESGGITQHIGAYHVDWRGKRATFIDTPGHEAFSAIRSRGAKVADIAVLVVAGDDGVKPQTKEAIEIIHKNELPFVVAINKIDKPDANPERVKQELAAIDVLIESYGGKVPMVEISAKTGDHMEELLDTILLVAEMEELRTDPDAPAQGVVIESHRDPRRGNTATILVRDGTLLHDHTLVIGRTVETIRILEDDAGNNVLSVMPSYPALISGLSRTATVGDALQAFVKKVDAQAYAETIPEPILTVSSAASAKIPAPHDTQLLIRIILKTDVAGSREALEHAIQALASEEIGIDVLRAAVGDIGEDDVKFAFSSSHVLIAGFRVKIDSAARQLIQQSGIRIVTAETIYALLDEIRQAVADVLPSIIKRSDSGRIQILKIFKPQGTKQIVGGRVEEGMIKKSSPVEIQRGENRVGKGVILQVQRGKTSVDEVSKGAECGIMVESVAEIKEGDILIAFEEQTVKRALL